MYTSCVLCDNRGGRLHNEAISEDTMSKVNTMNWTIMWVILCIILCSVGILLSYTIGRSLARQFCRLMQLN